jgi:probable rRNA maturation factor
MEGQPQAESIDLNFSLVAEAEAPPETTSGDLEDLLRYVLVTEGAAGCWDVTVALVDDERLQALHRNFLGHDTPTDIMTFPADDTDGICRGGELVISVDHARTQAQAWGMSPTNEIRFLVVHGMLHLLGWRDDTDAERDRMLERQRVVFDQWRSRAE